MWRRLLGALYLDLDDVGRPNEYLRLMLLTLHPDGFPWSPIDCRVITLPADGLQTVRADRHYHSWGMRVHWDLLAWRASNFENPNVLILEHDLVTNGIDFGGVWGRVHDAPFLVSPCSIYARSGHIGTLIRGLLRSTTVPAFDPQPFTLSIDEDEISDLRRRIAATRWPTPTPGDPWSQGTDLNYLRGFLRFWADEFDWSQQQRLLNELHHFRCEIDGVRLHYIHERARDGIGVPLILTHGWPSCFVEYVELIPLLTDPKSHGIDGPAFDVVVPSLPGYGFSERPDAVGVNYAYVARLWNQLMTNLGYSRFGAHGGDFGSGVSTMMALQEPDRLLGLHLTNLDIGHFDPGEQPWTTAENEFLEELDRWAETERGYSAIQSTKPQTLGYGLNDSPVGLAAWILEKWRSWTDSDGDPDLRLSRDFLATLLTIYWATGSITNSMRDYFDNRWHGVDVNPSTHVGVPTAIAVFGHQFVPEAEPPREWVERLYNVSRWSEMPAGGHFAPIEQPRLVAQDLAGFFADLAAP